MERSGSQRDTGGGRGPRRCYHRAGRRDGAGGRRVGNAPTGEVRREPFPLTLQMSTGALWNPNVMPALPAVTAAKDRQGP